MSGTDPDYGPSLSAHQSNSAAEVDHVAAMRLHIGAAFGASPTSMIQERQEDTDTEGMTKQGEK